MIRQKLLKFIRGIVLLPRRILILPIRFYRRFLSPLKGSGRCRFYPTCSEYAIEAITEWGVIAGSALAIRRILRCNPFGGFGHDPVPERKKKTTSAPKGVNDEQQP